MSKTVYVVMGNDYPDAVFSTEDEAQRYCEKQPKVDAASRRPMYWRVYGFVLDARASS